MRCSSVTCASAGDSVPFATSASNSTSTPAVASANDLLLRAFWEFRTLAGGGAAARSRSPKGQFLRATAFRPGPHGRLAAPTVRSAGRARAVLQHEGPRAPSPLSPNHLDRRPGGERRRQASSSSLPSASLHSIPFGRWQTGRNTRVPSPSLAIGARAPQCLPCKRKEAGAGRPHRSAPLFAASQWLGAVA